MAEGTFFHRYPFQLKSPLTSKDFKIVDCNPVEEHFMSYERFIGVWIICGHDALNITVKPKLS